MSASAARACEEHGAHGGPLAHHFDDLAQQHEASRLGMWAFLASEVMFFGGLFLCYTVYRYEYSEAFAQASHHLDVTLGTVNTAVLICSSLTMALAVRAAQVGKRRGQVAWLLATMLLGAAFLGIKAVEYAHKWHDGLIPGPSFAFEGPWAPQARIFYSFYFVMTGVHAFHMIVGIALLAWVARRASLGAYTPEHNTWIEMMGLYWHFVDVVWIYLFPLLYLIGAHETGGPA